MSPAADTQRYWIDSSDTCAGHAESVIEDEYWGKTRAIDAAGAEFDWSSAVVTEDEDEADRASVKVSFEGPDGPDSLTVRAEHVEGIGWQSRSSFSCPLTGGPCRSR